MIIIAAKGVIVEFGFLGTIFENVVVVEKGGVVADFMPICVSCTWRDIDAVVVVAFSANDELFEAFVSFGGDFGLLGFTGIGFMHIPFLV